MKVSITIDIDDRIVTFFKKLFPGNMLYVYALFAFLTATIAYTQTFSIQNPNVFMSGDVIDADKFNQNFSLLRNTINGAIGDIGSLETNINNALSDFEKRNNDLRNALTERMNTSMPEGIIVMWSGSVEDVPKGWEICDGLKNGIPDPGIPDLRDKFIVAAGDKFEFGNYDSPQHSHKIPHDHYFYTGEAGKHTHNWGYFDSKNYKWEFYDNNGSAGENPNISLSSPTTKFDYTTGEYIPLAIPGGNSRTLNTSESGSHKHDFTFSSNQDLTSGPAENKPPYYSLFYIIRTQ